MVAALSKNRNWESSLAILALSVDPQRLNDQMSRVATEMARMLDKWDKSPCCEEERQKNAPKRLAQMTMAHAVWVSRIESPGRERNEQK